MPLTTAIEHENLTKTRKSLFFAIVFTFAVANAELLSNQISVFGLEISVVQSDLVAFGQLVVIFLLSIFFLHSLVTVFEAISTLIKRVNERWNKRSMAEIERINNEMFPDPSLGHEDPYGHLEAWEYQHMMENQKRAKREDIAATVVDVAVGFRNFVLEYLLVLVAALFALINPKIIETAVQHWQSF
ncbi:hypothetical protein FGK63_00610 [Ruegeria sediminis]|uniref:Uncharacterized protein n=1 Tax=Ruegeria sediminis TaxID=2583820 RepID=A0ABY2X2K0_9RHOB|nr:hypothetical protein [Ruegeria sediminis]TMV09604.1 hypothetical protein FGK63_00610 [Ruegeria sediminis]